MPSFHLATFSSDVTPPLGHPLCGGWIEPARAVDDPLRARGVVMLGPGAPAVLCALDWCALCNDAHLAWRRRLAEAAHTTPERVAVHCLHAHNAPFADTEVQRLLDARPGAPPSLDLKFFDRALGQCADAVKASLARTAPFDHVGTGQARVEQVASSRRILGPDGKVRFVRYSATRDPAVRAEPEGLIDPWLKTLSFWDGDRPRAALHYYATHPMSYYGDGRVSCDFCGLAREQRGRDAPDVFQVYFTGCAGNVTAGKYNDGSHENRPVLRDRVVTAMETAWKATERYKLTAWDWRVEPVKLRPRRESSFLEAESLRALDDVKGSKTTGIIAAFRLAWLKRLDRPIDFTCLDLGRARVLHLPGEPFVEYQLRAQQLRRDGFVCVAGYGDGGPWYLPTDKAYLEGGYEPTVAFAAPSEAVLDRTLATLLQVPR